MTVNYSLHFPTGDAAERAARALAAEGFAVTWGINAANDAHSRADIEDVRKRMQQLADELGGDFLGSGGFSRLPDQ